MARIDLKKLYRALVDRKFQFMGRSEQHIHDIYCAVKETFPLLCDDRYLCIDNCSSGIEQPEWKHTVRSALKTLKSDTGPVGHGGKRNYWIFR